jgi:sporulation protein YlmC with PRC-barrel domain
MQPDTDHLDGAIIYDLQGDRIGTVEDVYVDEETQRPVWLMVDPGFFGKVRLVPTGGMSPVDDGFQIPFSKDAVKSAPDVTLEDDMLSDAEERDLCSYYGVTFRRSVQRADGDREHPPGERAA